ncbi:D-alanyl-D-alanine carboxypeptidase/D-alanyl-D-alanine-endopeptidase [Pseudoclavibacter endophyticus]|uniref:D-alanyl-D-alanine carboxypeptidase/D-alanyl-D-alanine endopeptidase n=1 Tax=Pseudoclavibacter endophyticus TaxID=1778590 RepID=UPI0016650270|nr:D-alanyl-D-alanine carboxypeptidase/D-alanyl-D-alanine-endopeptidase [Pseudoclavibacter endophyticus]GGA70191.1 D-alanyl-D-alanine carboxypeptidase/D-alanyl-D-alanine-endopeptidase [Pseudoclavibacter endophyticus]
MRQGGEQNTGQTRRPVTTRRDGRTNAAAAPPPWTVTDARKRREPRAVPVPLAIVVVLVGVLIAGAAFAGGSAFAASTTVAAGETSAPKAYDSAQLAPERPPGAAPLRTCSLDEITAQPGALEFHGYAIDSQTGEVLFDRRAGSPNPTASTMKLITAAAALTVLGPDYRIPTRVYAGELQGEVIIVGYGDVTLTSLSPGQTSYYNGATAYLSDLANQTLEARGDQAIRAVSYDDSFYDGDEWHQTWNEQDRLDGYMPPISALMVDGGRQGPQSLVSLRTEKPAESAVTHFAERLGLSAADVLGTQRVPEGAPMLAEVWSQPVSELIRYALLDSDNVVAETLARLVAIESGAGNTYNAINPALTQAVENLGLDAAGFTAMDGSGLSRDNRVTARLEVALLQLVGGDEFGLGRILDDLPASGISGTLNTRFDPASSGVPAASIRAKTGWIDEVYGLAGFIDSADGTRITFAYYVAGPVQISNRDVLDSIAAATYRCGGGLADW